MHEFVNFNHRLLPAKNAFLQADSAAALCGRGIFTTVAIYNFQPFLWEKHWARLTAHAAKVGVDLSDFSASTTLESLLEIIEKNDFRTGRARLTLYDESPSLIWRGESPPKTNLLIQTADLRRIKHLVKLTVSPFPINSQSPLAGVKSCNYLENILAWEDAKSRGFDEAIRLNEKDEIVSACLANVFWKRNGECFTSSLATGCLDGTTRRYVLENQAVSETRASLNDLLEADEIFLTSAGIGIVNAVISR